MHRNELRHLLLAVVSLFAACSRSSSPHGLPRIHVKGSDTMIAMSSAWAEAYDRALVEVGGGGSGVGISELIRGTIDIANVSRPMSELELEAAQKRTGRQPVCFVVGHDAVAVYVNPDNPIEEMSIEQLAGIFGEDGKIRRWSDLGVAIPGLRSDDVVPVSRDIHSGTRECFGRAILGATPRYRKDLIVTLGSRDLVTLVSKVPGAIGYSGMGFAMEGVKVLRVRSGNRPSMLPSIQTVQDRTYPISRPLLIYTLGQPEGAVREYVDWVRSERGQEILACFGEVPLFPIERGSTRSGFIEASRSENPRPLSARANAPGE